VQANQLAAVLLLILPFFIAVWWAWRQHKPIKWGFGTIIVGCLALLLVSQSRMGWLGFAGGMVSLVGLWWWFMPASSQRQQTGKWLARIAIFATLLVLVSAPFVIPRIVQTPSAQTSVGNFASAPFRVEVWHWGWVGVQDFPLTGMGLGTFRAVARRLYPVDVALHIDLGHAHNIFLQTALDLGLLGLGAYGWVLVNAGILTLKKATTQPTHRYLWLGLLASFIALHTFGMADALALGSKPGILFWWALGLISHQDTNI
jgi:putative inorganic carbon (HCO3(-)) transporter